MRPLTSREEEVLSLAATGRTNPEIAEYLRIGVDSVKHHLRGCYLKMGVRDRAQAIAEFRLGRLPGPTLRALDRGEPPCPPGIEPTLWATVPAAARRCYRMRLSGMSNAQIALALGLRPDTVKNQSRVAARRLGRPLGS